MLPVVHAPLWSCYRYSWSLFVEGFSVVENLRKKKSHAAEVADMAARIVECLTPEEAQKLIKKIKEDKK